MTHHDLKIWPIYFVDVAAGRKTFEIRREDDRVFQIGDTINLREWDPASTPGDFTGRTCLVEVTYIGTIPFIHGYVGMSIRLIGTNMGNEIDDGRIHDDFSSRCRDTHCDVCGSDGVPVVWLHRKRWCKPCYVGRGDRE